MFSLYTLCYSIWCLYSSVLCYIRPAVYLALETDFKMDLCFNCLPSHILSFTGAALSLD